MKGNKTTTLVVCAAMIALEIILCRFVGFTSDAVRFSIDFLPIVVVGMICGPVWGAAAYAVGDLLGSLLFPMGPINPGITLVAALVGAVYGLVFYRRDLSGKRIYLFTAVAAAIVFIIKLLLTTFFLAWMYGAPYTGMMVTRIPTCVVLLVGHLVLIPLVYKLIVAKLPMYRAIRPRGEA